MKKSLNILAALFLAASVNAQFVEFVDTFSVQHADVVAVDIDDDNDLDIIISGEDNGNARSAIMINDAGVYSIQQSTNVIAPGHFADIKVGDVDGNGTLDVLFNGNAGTDESKGIVLNDGNGVFTKSALDVTGATISCGFADFNNDGLVDYYVWGNGLSDGGSIFFKNQDETYTEDTSSFLAYDIIDPDVSIVDFNNDGYVDMFVSGWDNGGGSRFSTMFVNDGFGAFTPFDQPNIIRKGFGSSVWADVDGDGWMDLLLNGDGGADGEGSSDIFRLYRNNGGVFEAKATFNDYRQISVGDGAKVIDWDNDGDLDVLLSGWSVTKDRQATLLFDCTDATNFTYVENDLSDSSLPGLSESSLDVADLNQDGKIDLLLTGYSGNQESQVGKFDRNISGCYFNQSTTANTAPTAPSNLHVELSQSGDEKLALFSWDAATDAESQNASLTYNMSLKNTNTGKWLYNPMAVIGGNDDGWRKIVAHGNVFTNMEWEVYNLPKGDYEWNVQAIDVNFTGGAFASAGSFTVSDATDIEQNEISKAKVYSANDCLKVELEDCTSMSLIQVYSIDGSLLFAKSAISTFEQSVNSGLYLVKVSNSEFSTVTRVLVK